MAADVNRLVDMRKSSNRFDAILREPHLSSNHFYVNHLWFMNHILSSNRFSILLTNHSKKLQSPKCVVHEPHVVVHEPHMMWFMNHIFSSNLLTNHGKKLQSFWAILREPHLSSNHFYVNHMWFMNHGKSSNRFSPVYISVNKIKG